MLEKLEEVSILYDFYGELLPERQQEMFRLYHEDNYSLAEIASEYDMSRQGVHEAVKRSEEKLLTYEKKLGLVRKFLNTEVALGRIEADIKNLLEEHSENPSLCKRLHEIESVLEALHL